MASIDKVTIVSKRLNLHEELEAVFPSGYRHNLYYQPPANISLQYPCIEYSFDGVKKVYADNRTYLKSYIFTGTVISKNVDDPIFDSLIELEGFRIIRRAVVDGLYHLYFSITY